MRRSATRSAICAKNQPGRPRRSARAAARPVPLPRCALSPPRREHSDSAMSRRESRTSAARHRLPGHVPARRRRSRRRAAAARCALAAVAGQRASSVSRTRLAGVRILRRHDTAADVAERRDDGVADRDAAADPLVLLVLARRRRSRRASGSGGRRPARQRPPPAAAARARRARSCDAAAAADAAIDGAALRPEQRQRLAGELGHRLLPRAATRRDGCGDAVERRLDRLAGLDDALDALAAGQLERQLRASPRPTPAESASAADSACRSRAGRRRRAARSGGRPRRRCA